MTSAAICRCDGTEVEHVRTVPPNAGGNLSSAIPVDSSGGKIYMTTQRNAHEMVRRNIAGLVLLSLCPLVGQRLALLSTSLVVRCVGQMPFEGTSEGPI